MITIDTNNGRVISHGFVPLEVIDAADECFLAYRNLNEKIAKFQALLPEDLTMKSFYGTGDCVIIQTKKEAEENQKYWAENS